MKRLNALTQLAAVSLICCASVAAQTAQPPAPKEIVPEMFASPEQAVQALIAAASNNDRTRLTAILGSASQSLLTSGNAAQDQQERQEFSRLAQSKSHVERSTFDSGTAVLLIGDEDWPFPIPLVRTGQQWHFDPGLGAMEMRARKIGANELDAIEICNGYVNAQDTYSEQQLSGRNLRAYAQKIMGSPGAHDGLYQPGAPQELVPDGFAMAAASSQEHKPYHGYYFRVLREQGPNAPGGAHKYVAGGSMIGGFALIGWSAEYGVTGIHTFIVNHDGDVFEKDLGPRTTTLAAQIDRYDPDNTWALVDGL